MKNLFSFIAILFLTNMFAQKGTISGTLTDKDMNNETLPFANVMIQGTTIGTTSDMDGTYSLSVEPGQHTIVFSFLGYKTETETVTVVAGKNTVVNKAMGADSVMLDDVVVVASVNREKESALLLEQKKAVSIKTSIGSQELAKKGVSDVATAVTKAAGISKQEGSNNIYVRGLGDRYNSTTLNGLPLPSNDPSKKNISLDIFTTDIVEFIDINKTYNSEIYGDFGGASVDIISKSHSGKPKLEFGVGTGAQSNAIVLDDFHLQDGPNKSGLYSIDYPNNPFIPSNHTTSWDKQTVSTPISTNFGLLGGHRLNFGKSSSLDLFGTASFSNGYQFKRGIARGSVNTQGLAFSDYDFSRFSYDANTTAMLNLGYRINEKHKIKYNTLFVNSSSQTYDQYRGIINVFDNAPEGGGYIRRGTFIVSKVFVNQLLGEHKLSERLDVDWGMAHNIVNNNIPDRKQNMLVPRDNNNVNGDKIVSDLATSDNHRFFQNLNETENAVNLIAKYKFGMNEDNENKGLLNFGYSGRFKVVDFDATQFNYRINRFIGIPYPTVNINNIDGYFNDVNFANGLYDITTFRGDASNPRALEPQTYKGEQNIHAAIASLQYKISKKFTGIIGLRLERIYQKVQWKTSLDPNGDKNSFTIFEYLPNATFKYATSEKNNLKFAASKTYTLTQFKERAPFQYEDVTEISFGNPDLNPSTNYNTDLKWEYFPSSGEVIALTAFGKIIQNPINMVVVASATNDLSYVNSGEKATIAGLEFEVRKNIFETQNEETTKSSKLSTGFNTSWMYGNQDYDINKVANETDLNVVFSNTNGPLTGASDLLVNADISFTKDFSQNSDVMATLAYNYFSDRVYAIGTYGKGDLTDQAVGTLDFIVKSNLSKHFNISLSLKNILDPKIERIQEVQNVTVLSYKRGRFASLSVTYKI